MSNKISKISAKCMEEIRNKPGILRSELYAMNIGHRSSIQMWVSRLVCDGIVVRVWDDTQRSYRLYPKGKEPPPHQHKEYKPSLYSRTRGFCHDAADPGFNEGHGDKFYTAFDEAYGLLYIDLKMLGMAAQKLS